VGITYLKSFNRRDAEAQSFIFVYSALGAINKKLTFSAPLRLCGSMFL